MQVAIVRQPADPIASSAPVGWAVDRLRSTLEDRSVHVSLGAASHADSLTLVVIGQDRPEAARAISECGAERLNSADSFALLPMSNNGADVLLVCGGGVRGLLYGVLELADRVEHGSLDAIHLPKPVVERPANAVRSVMRLFCSEVEDKQWFHDDSFWERYLSMLAAQRFNRFSLTFGLGYNYHRGVTDAYLYFAYPFLVSVPGYGVRVPQLPDEERTRNLEMLRHISDQTVARGMDFQLGLWTHAYEWIDSPDAHHTIEGLTPEAHAAYCRDAVGDLLELCPAIGGLTFRIHGESGIPEGSWAFWKTVFEGVSGAGRRVGIDLHAKGLDDRTLGLALDTGLPVTVSPKFWAEHMGPPYHQAAIRERERVVREDPSHLSEWHRSMSISEGSRPFTRYGYADFLREDRSYDVVFRLWPGTQRLLLWGDPVFAAGYGRAAGLAGAQGLEWFEPLCFKGREGSGVEGSRNGYADASLDPADDWMKHAYTYRLFGRLTYDPDAPADGWRRALIPHFGRASHAAESALSCASRILPLVTVAHHASASNNFFWPEIYTDMPIVWKGDETRPHPYLDTPPPRRFGTVSPLDPEVFSSVADFVSEREGVPSGRVSPLQVAMCLDRLAEAASLGADAAERGVNEPDAEVRRWLIDVRILAALGRFFAGKLRAAIHFERHVDSGGVDELECAVEAYRLARSAWADAMTVATGVYVDDLTFGPQPRLRGHWRDRLAAIDLDLAHMERLWDAAYSQKGDRPSRPAVEPLASERLDHDVEHVVPAAYRPGADLSLEVRISGALAGRIRRVTVRYRPMNQALPFSQVEMERVGNTFVGSIPGEDLTGTYPVAYAFVVLADDDARRVPDLGADLASQPYYAIRRAETGGRSASP